MHCPACAVDVNPIVTLGDHMGMVRLCPRCNSTLEAINASTPRNQAKQEEPHPVSQPAPKQQRRKQESQPFDVIKEAKRRKRFVSAEVKRLRKELKAAEREEAQLERLLAAADAKPEAKVKLIRAS